MVVPVTCCGGGGGGVDAVCCGDHSGELSAHSREEFTGGGVAPDGADRRVPAQRRDAAIEAAWKGSAAAVLETGSGHRCYVSFTLADPPEVSYLKLHWPVPPANCTFPNLPARPYILATDENIFLVRTASHCKEISSDLFVYMAGHPSSVLRLPSAVDGKSLCNFSLGILRLAGCPDSYIVSDLIVSAKKHVSRPSNPIWAKLRFYSSKTKKWKILDRPVLHTQFPNLWSTDDVLPFDGRFLCWVDYFSGVLLADFSKKYSSALHYVPFPGKEYPDIVRVSRLCPGRFRSVSISQGAMRFVHIENDWQESLQVNYDWDHIERPERSEGQPLGSKIIIWTLNMVHRGDFNFRWEVHRVINLDCLWGQCIYQSKNIPQRLPEFPSVKVDDPDVLCCLVREEKIYGKAWMIMVGMKNADLLSSTPYINEKLCSAEGTGVEARRSMFSDVPLLPTVFFRGLNAPAAMEMAQLICGGCRTLLMYTRNTDTVTCSCCNTVNLVKPGMPCNKDKLATRPSKKGKLLM